MFVKKMHLEDSLVFHIPLQNGADKADAFGVEVELEGKKICTPTVEISKYWGTHNDGSLRKLALGDEAIEYTFRQPFDLKQTEKGINLLFEYLNTPPAEVFVSYRTSIHVHVNYSQERFRTIYNAMALSIILDELLTSQNGEHRIGNNFCLRAKDAMGQVVQLCNSIENIGTFFDISANNRYSSINFASLMKFGTIEYRSLECTTHANRLMHWIGTLQAIKESARGKFKNPTEIIQQFSMVTPDVWLKAILGPFAIKYLQVPDYEHMLVTGMRIAQDFAFCSQWNEGNKDLT
jgi:hypothetical protein